MYCGDENFNARKVIRRILHVKHLYSLQNRAVLFRLFPRTVNLPPIPLGFRLTFIQ